MTAVAEQTSGRQGLTKGVPLPALVLHCSLYMADRHVAEDFDCVTSVAASPEDAAALRKYRRARMRAPGYRRHAYDSNSHRSIAVETLRTLTEGSAARHGDERECRSCGRRFTSRRSDAVTCSARCRQRLRRSGPGPRVTDTRP